ncbi:hypothetical protein SEA_SKOG_113 [Gordonia phage Skog]|uniref:Uncharacterized protein n=1 Tax=Gordonia phage Skog TaxID=2704033 RepID=A0A6G6XK88_9CAUD|nr:hypothetical protein KHQ85_gp113 [Gordonia phage Skog]QIG58265.1 hypothetical protein SEA_SKOG_113 [Gordonia phage Skog]
MSTFYRALHADGTWVDTEQPTALLSADSPVVAIVEKGLSGELRNEIRRVLLNEVGVEESAKETYTEYSVATPDTSKPEDESVLRPTGTDTPAPRTQDRKVAAAWAKNNAGWFRKDCHPVLIEREVTEWQISTPPVEEHPFHQLLVEYTEWLRQEELDPLGVELDVQGVTRDWLSRPQMPGLNDITDPVLKRFLDSRK